MGGREGGREGVFYNYHLYGRLKKKLRVVVSIDPHPQVSRRSMFQGSFFAGRWVKRREKKDCTEPARSP